MGGVKEQGIAGMFEYSQRLEPLQRAKDLENMVELLEWDLQLGIEDTLNDSLRPDVKQLLSEVEQSIGQLRRDILATVEKLAKLPESR